MPGTMKPWWDYGLQICLTSSFIQQKNDSDVRAPEPLVQEGNVLLKNNKAD